MKGTLNIAFVWHMHQPLYKDPSSGEYTMPWVLLHATKDYLDMVSILEEFPDIHQTINLVPCLIDQIKDYASGKARDAFRNVAMRPAEELKRGEKRFLLKNFFHANRETMIRPIERYRELLNKRGATGGEDELNGALRSFNAGDYRDLQVLFNLVWIDPVLRERDAFLKGLVRKGRGFTEKEKARLLEKQIEIAGAVIPKHAELQERGIIEVSTSPYYHPIMPLLYDSEVARVSMPGITLPLERFNFPEDAVGQMRRGIELYKKTFGRPPRGVWPSEGSLSTEILQILRDEGMEWTATDEEILTNTLRRPLRRDSSGNCLDAFLYKPYAFEKEGARITVLFRDHVLSDLIGFDYAKMDPGDAADDFVRRLLNIYGLFERPADHVVNVILDGENAWECYANDGRDFLLALYGKISRSRHLKCVTVSEYLSGNPPAEKISGLYPGSWINHNFKIWIGHPEDNTAWDYIYGARKALVEHAEGLGPEPGPGEKDALAEAWDALYAAEGSDWFWWYGEEHSSTSDEHFDTLFREHVRKVYSVIKREPPVSLDIPIITEEKVFSPSSLPGAYLKPVIDGEITNYFEWMAAGRIQYNYFGTAMHREAADGGLVEGISYGFSPEELFLRLDYIHTRAPFEKEWSFTLTFIHPAKVKIKGIVKGKKSGAVVFEKPSDREEWVETGPVERIASDTVVEVALPLKALGVRPADEMRLYITIDAGVLGVERWPMKGSLRIEAPGADFEQEQWMV